MLLRACFRVLFIWVLLSGVSVNASTITTKKLSDSLYVFYAGKGLGLNVTASIGKDGIVLIDTMNAKNDGAKKLLAAIRAISDKPIKYVINTDSDSVHVGGYTFFSKLGATIIAHQDANISDDIATIRYSDSLVIYLNDQRFELYHHIANSIDDTIVFLPRSNLLITGNIYSQGWFPVFFSGGIAGFNSAVSQALGLANESTQILPSTGTLTNANALRSFQHSTNEMIARIHQLRLLETKAKDIVNDDELNEIWSRIAGGAVFNDRLKQRMVDRYISTDFTAKFPLSTDQLAHYIGEYQFEDKAIASIFLRDNKLFLKVSGITELIAQSNSLFHIRGSVGASIKFELNIEGNVSSFTYAVQNEKYKAIKL